MPVEYVLVEEFIKTTLRLPESKIKELKHIAIDENKTLTEVIDEAIDDYLIKKQKNVKKK